MRIWVSIFVAGLAAMAIFAQCASVGAPEGGPRDSLAPLIVLMEPMSGATNFDGKRIYIEFDEYVQIRNQQDEFFTSPMMDKMPTVTLRGRGIQIDIADSLAPDRTYALDFGQSIVDNNESNPLSDLRFVFSTGPIVDSMLLSAWTVDGYSGDSAPRAFLYLYPDTIPFASNGDDSTLFRKPAAIARAHPDGLVLAQNLQPIPYRIYAFDDTNGNRTYEPGVDRVGFVDQPCNPQDMPGFRIRWDTLMLRSSPDPQLQLRLFMDEGFQRQTLRNVSRPEKRRIGLKFSAKEPVIDSFALDSIAPEQLLWYYPTPSHDSIVVWLAPPDSLLPDTLRGNITYHRHDSINNLVPHSQPLALVWRDLAALQRERDSIPPAPEFKYRVEASPQLNPYHNIGFRFEYPLSRLDSGRVSLQRLDFPEELPAAERADSLAVRVNQPVRFEHDTIDMRHIVMHADWVDGARYELMIPAGVFRDITGERNDTLRSSFNVRPIEEFASLELQVVGADSLSEYIVEITDASGSNVLRSFPHMTNGPIRVTHLEPGTVRIRITEDANRDGRWSAGNLLRRLQSERTQVLAANPDGSPDITLRANWSMDYTLDIPALFTPVTMQSMQRQLHALEQERLEKAEKARAEADKQRQQQQNPNQGMGFGNIGSNPIPIPGR